MRRSFVVGVALTTMPLTLWAGGTQSLEPVEVIGRGLVGAADSATEGTVTQRQITTRAWLRPGEVLETVPGLIVTQHTGDGKANQFFLRGFNLDHGTDFATFALGMPVNLPTHAHGQGYTDVNFLIPELISGIRYRKGPYSVHQGDFGAAGSASVDYVRTLPATFLEAGFGENGFRRGVAATSPRIGDGNLLIGGEVYRNDGPWRVPQDYRKNNVVLRYTSGDERNGWDLTLLGYKADWDSTDQVAYRAISQGLIDRFGTLDPTSGGDTKRNSLSWQWASRTEEGEWRASAYAVQYELDLFSNFTYFATDPVNGDQFEQADDRKIVGGHLERTITTRLGGRELDLTLGARVRRDNIDEVGLRLTSARQRLATIRVDKVTQTAAATYAEVALRPTDWLRLVAGARLDAMDVDVESDTVANSGKERDAIVTPKFAAVLGPWARTELYLNFGHGFHSNDARGAVINVNPDPRDPNFGGAAERVPLLVRARGSELGVRSVPLPGWQTSLALWRLELASELVFVGDAGTTEASRPSMRQGIEFANYWTPLPGLTVDLDVSLSRARFRDSAPEGDRIPGAIERTMSFGAAYDAQGMWFGGVRLRHFGPRPLVENNSARSSSSTILNMRVGWRPTRRLELIADVINLFDRKFNDIEYFYESQLLGEAAPVEDVHLHPGEPRTFRLSLRYLID